MDISKRDIPRLEPLPDSGRFSAASRLRQVVFSNTKVDDFTILPQNPCRRRHNDRGSRATRRQTGLAAGALSGGCMANRRLSGRSAHDLAREGFYVLRKLNG